MLKYVLHYVSDNISYIRMVNVHQKHRCEWISKKRFVIFVFNNIDGNHECIQDSSIT